MAEDVATLRLQLDRLRNVRAGGTRSVRYRNGEEERETQFSTDRDLSAAIVNLKRRIGIAEGRRSPTVIRFSTSKGL